MKKMMFTMEGNLCAARIKEGRYRHDPPLTQEDLARKIQFLGNENMTSLIISRIEKNQRHVCDGELWQIATALGVTMESPEMFISNAAVKAIAVGLLSVPLFFIFKLLGLFVVVIAIFMYYRETKSVSLRIKAKRRNIEYELPRLVSSIAKMLKHNRDIVYILESYRETAGPDLKTELDITVADMRSGNTEVALTRLESRIGSTMVSDITRGLIAVTRGNDTDVYWAQLEMKFTDYQRQSLKAQANAVPRKMKKLSMALLFCFILIYAAVIGQVMLSSMSALF